MRIEKIPHGVSVRIEPAEPVAGAPYRRGEPDPGRLIIEHCWSDPELSPGVGGNAALVMCMVIAVVGFWFEPSLSGAELVTLVLFFLGPIVAMYLFMAVRWNTTTYTLDAVRLTVRHGPIPVPGNRSIARADITGITHRYIDNPHDDWSGGSIVVIARLRSGKEAKLVTRACDYEQYQFVAEQLSGHLERTRS